jgi:hypothetical protein
MISRENQAIGAASSLLPATISRAASFFAGMLAAACPIIIQHMLSLISAQISSIDLPRIPRSRWPAFNYAGESGKVVADEAEKCRTVIRAVSRKLKSKEDRSSERR